MTDEITTPCCTACDNCVVALQETLKAQYKITLFLLLL